MNFRMKYLRLLAVVGPISATSSSMRVYGDNLLFEYTGDVLPYDPGGGFQLFDPCEFVCNESLSDSYLIIEWVGGGNHVNYNRTISAGGEEPPTTLWIEWRFRGNLAYPSGETPSCGGRVSTQFRNIVDLVYLHGDGVVWSGEVAFILGLEVDQFRTLRFESLNGANYTFALDGDVFVGPSRPPPGPGASIVQFGGAGNCERPSGTAQRVEWDFVRYGTTDDGELIVASDPPPGIVNSFVHPNLDRFVATFDRPGFVYIDDVSVAVTGGDLPSVEWARRLDNGGSDTVQIVLDRPIPLNATTTFTFDTGGVPQVIEYTYLPLGACCSPTGLCAGTEELDCGDIFIPGEECSGDGDGDGVDGACGDECPMDENKFDPGQCGCGVADVHSDSDGVADCLDGCPTDANKTAPGQCGCGTPDFDSDGDTVADCLDQCDGEDDTIDEDGDGIPDCAQFRPIPTTSVWGLGIMALLLLIAAKLRSIRCSSHPSPLTPRLSSLIRHSLFDIRHSAALLVVLGATADAAVKYAKTDGLTSGNCDSWAAACTLEQARAVAASGDEIWVKASMYGPFALKNGVKIVGGFAGTETAASQSNPATNVTIVDGGDQDQCITGNGEGPTTVLRGFTIKNCYIDGTDPIGAGIFLKDSSARIVQCIIEQNDAQFFGAGAGLSGTGSPEFINCTFRNNGTGSGTSALPYGGGAVFLHSGSVKFVNCLFHDNIAGEGGAVVTVDATATFINCTFTENSAEIGNGGAIFDGEGKLTIHNSIIWNNSANRIGPNVYNQPKYASTITYSDVQGGYTGTGNINSNPLFTNPSGNDFKITPCSPCQNAGSNALLPADVADLDWDTNTTESIPKDLVSANRKIGFVVDMGAYETTTCTE